MGMDQYLLIPFLGGWTSIYQLFWCSPGVQGFDTLPYTPSIINHKYIHELKKQRIRNCNISQIQISHFRFCQVQQSQNLAEWSCWAIPATLITGEFCTAVAVFEAPAQRPRNEHTLALPPSRTRTSRTQQNMGDAGSQQRWLDRRIDKSPSPDSLSAGSRGCCADLVVGLQDPDEGGDNAFERSKDLVIRGLWSQTLT